MLSSPRPTGFVGSDGVNSALERRHVDVFASSRRQQGQFFVQIDDPLSATITITITQTSHDGVGLGDEAPFDAMGGPDGTTTDADAGGAVERALQDAGQRGVFGADVEGGLAQLALVRLVVAPQEAGAAEDAHAPVGEVEDLQARRRGGLVGLRQRPRKLLQLVPVQDHVADQRARRRPHVLQQQWQRGPR